MLIMTLTWNFESSTRWFQINNFWKAIGNTDQKAIHQILLSKVYIMTVKVKSPPILLSFLSSLPVQNKTTLQKWSEQKHNKCPAVQQQYNKAIHQPANYPNHETNTENQNIKNSLPNHPPRLSFLTVNTVQNPVL